MTGGLIGFDRYDDCLDIEETEVGQLALKRLSAKESYDRVYRIRRAVQLSLSHKILPKEQWTKMEDVSFIPEPIYYSFPRTRDPRYLCHSFGGGVAVAFVYLDGWLTGREQDKPYISPIIEQIKAAQKEKAALDTMEVLPKH